MTKPILRVLGGEPLWPPPIWLMRQAGRYLPEYRAIKEQTGDFLAMATNPEIAAEITLQPVRRFGMDGAILFSDILIVPWALGQGLRYGAGEGPVLPPIRDEAGLAALDMSHFAERIAPVAETARRVRAAEPAGCTLIGFAGSPWTVACYMVDGRGTKEFTETRRLAYAEPGLFARLISLLTETTIVYLGAQIEAGAEAVMLFDSWAGLLPPALFDRHVTGPTEAITAAIHDRYPGVPVIGFPRLAGTQLGRYAMETAVEAVAMDTGAQPEIVAALVPEGVALQGNLDPLALLAGGPELSQQAEDIALALRGRPHVFNLGHGVLQHTPVEHVAELVAAVRNA